MNKLTNIHAAFAPLPDRRESPAVAPFHATSARNASPKAVVSRPGLRRSWARDEAGYLVCSWSEASSPTQDQSIGRRGRCRAGAAISMAA